MHLLTHPLTHPPASRLLTFGGLITASAQRFRLVDENLPAARAGEDGGRDDGGEGGGGVDGDGVAITIAAAAAAAAAGVGVLRDASTPVGWVRGEWCVGEEGEGEGDEAGSVCGRGEWGSGS